MRLIDADELLDIYHHDADCDLYEALDITPTIQAVPIDVLDKIRAEIVYELDHLKNYRDKDMAVYCRMTACKKHIAIIDKYNRKEQE